MTHRPKYLSSIYFLLFFQFSLNSRLVAQIVNQKPSLVCSYQLKYQQDSTDKSIRKEYFTLVIGQSISKFQNPRSRMRDSLRSVMMGFIKQPEIMSTYMKKVMELSMESYKYIIYKEKLSKKIIYYDWIGSKLYSYEEQAPIFKWIISSKTATIAGYICQQATTVFGGRIFEAWFTREVPVSDGPYKFYGLPGLIVKVIDRHQHYTFELVSLKTSTSISNPSLPSYPSTPTTKSELRQGQTNYQTSLTGPTPSFGNIPSVPATAARREAVIKFNKKRNNPLELK